VGAGWGGWGRSGVDQREAGALGVVELVVDGDQRVAGSIEDRGGDRGAVARGAVHPELAGGDLVEPFRQLVQRDVQRALQVAAGVLVGAAYVEDRDLAVVTHLGEVAEPGGREARPLLAGRPRLGAAGGVRRGT